MITDPTSTTAGDICTSALKECGVIGVGQTPLAEDLFDAQARLQWMLQQWERKRWLVWHLVTFGVVATGAQSYTFGPGGQINTNVLAAYGLQGCNLVAPGAGYAVNDTINLLGSPAPPSGGTAIQLLVTSVGAGGAITGFIVQQMGAVPSPLPTTFAQGSTSGAGAGATFNLPVWTTAANPITTTGGSVRPARIESAFLRQIQNSEPNQIDYPLDILQSREDYNRIALKSLNSFPGCIFYDSAWPIGTIWAWPVPQAAIYSVNVSVLEQLPLSFLTQATKLNVPYEYYWAMVTNLALRLRGKYQLPTFPGDTLPAQAKESLNVIRGANVQIARLTLPTDMQRPGIYNIFSDRMY